MVESTCKGSEVLPSTENDALDDIERERHDYFNLVALVSSSTVNLHHCV
jgi:hypothetical protein